MKFDLSKNSLMMTEKKLIADSKFKAKLKIAELKLSSII